MRLIQIQVSQIQKILQNKIDEALSNSIQLRKNDTCLHYEYDLSPTKNSNKDDLPQDQSGKRSFKAKLTSDMIKKLLEQNEAKEDEEKYTETKTDNGTYYSPKNDSNLPEIRYYPESRNYSSLANLGTCEIDSENADRMACCDDMTIRMEHDRTVKRIFCTHQENLVAVGLVSRHAEKHSRAFEKLDEQEIPSTELVYLVTNKTKGAGQAIIQSLFHRTLDVEPLWLEAGPSQVPYFIKFGFENPSDDDADKVKLLFITKQKIDELRKNHLAPFASDQHGPTKSPLTDVK